MLQIQCQEPILASPGPRKYPAHLKHWASRKMLQQNAKESAKTQLHGRGARGVFE